MVRKSPPLLNLVEVYNLNISVPTTESKFEPLSSDDKTADGLNPSGLLVDELHKHKTRALLDVLDCLFSKPDPMDVVRKWSEMGERLLTDGPLR